ncbi:MAG TPA: TetR/AcrR family transcriptional regulator [Chthoniobacterales bacterium]
MSGVVSQANPLRARRDEEKLQRRNEILDAAEAVIRKHGWENTDFGKIAKVARLSRSLLYTYFATRDHLFHAICDRGLEMLEARFIKALATHSKGLDQVMAMGHAYWDFSKKSAFYFELLSQFQTKSWNPEEHLAEEENANLHGRGCLRMLAQAIATGIADASIRKSIGEPGPASFTIWAFTHGVIQIATQKEYLVQEDLGMNSGQMIEHSLQLLRTALAAE